MIGISENSQRSYLIGPKGKFIKKKSGYLATRHWFRVYAQPSRKCSNIEILAKIERKKKINRILAPPRSYQVLIQAKKNQNFTCVLLKVVFSFFHLQLFDNRK